MLLCLGVLIFYVEWQSDRLEAEFDWVNWTHSAHHSLQQAHYLAIESARKPAAESKEAREEITRQLDRVLAETDSLLNGKLLPNGDYGRAITRDDIRRDLVEFAGDVRGWRAAIENVWVLQDHGHLTKELVMELERHGFVLLGQMSSIQNQMSAKMTEYMLLEHYSIEALVVALVIGVVVLFIFLRIYSGRLLHKDEDLHTALRELEIQRKAIDGHSIIAITDIQGVITDVNDKFCQISGYSREELIGKTHRIINSGYHPKEFFENMWQTITRGRPWHGEVLNRNKSGDLYWVDTTIMPFIGLEGLPDRFVAIRTEITKRKEYEQVLSDSERRLAKQNLSLRRMARYKAPDKPLDQQMKVYSETVAQTLKVNRVSIWLVDDAYAYAYCADVYDLGKMTHGVADDIVIAECPTFFSTMEVSHILTAPDISKDYRLNELQHNYFQGRATTSLLSVCIHVANKVAGLLMLEHSGSERQWSLDEQNFATSIGDFISAKIKEDSRIKVEDALKVVAKITPQSTVERFCYELLKQVEQGLDADWVMLGRLSVDRQRIYSIVIVGDNVADDARVAFNVQGQPSERVLAVQESFMEEGPVSASWPQLVLGEEFNILNYMEAPLINSQGESIGVLVAINKASTMGFSMAESMLNICSARVASELERAKSQERLRALVDTMSDIVWETDANGVITYCSDNVTHVLGYAVTEVVGRQIREFISEDGLEGIGKDIARHMLRREPIRNLEYCIHDKQQREIYFLYNAIPLFDEHENLVGYHGINTDITKRKSTEARTRLMAAAIDQSLEGVVITDVNGIVEYVNPAYLRITGFSLDLVHGRPVLEAGVACDDEMLAKIDSSIQQGKPFTQSFSNKRRNGIRFEQELILTPIHEEGGRLTNCVIGLRDITQEAMLEQQARQSQKMQAIGTLAGGIAHDFNNILSAILGYSDLTMEDLPDDSLARDNIGQVIAAANRAKELVQQILAFSRQNNNMPKLLAPQKLTGEVLRLIRATLPAMVEIETDFHVEGLSVRMDPTQYHQLVMNLMVNAGHAIGERAGKIRVELKRHEARAGKVQRVDLAPGDYVCLVVEDTGIGMTPDIIERIFDPFFTTKGVDEGTGMGLAAVHGIVTSAGGVISVASEPGKGSRFEVYLPCSGEGVVPREDVAPESASTHVGKGFALVVDDDEIQAGVVCKMLKRMGYDVEKHVDSLAALEAFKQQPDHYQLVVTDVKMPGMTGDKLAQALLAIQPELPIVMCTGYSEEVTPEVAKAIGVREYIYKPIMMRDLQQALERIGV